MAWQEFYSRRRWSGYDDRGKSLPIPKLEIRKTLDDRQFILVQVTSEVARPTWRIAGNLAIRRRTGGTVFVHKEPVVGLNNGPYWFQLPTDPYGFEFRAVRWLWDYEIHLWKWTGAEESTEPDVPPPPSPGEPTTPTFPPGITSTEDGKIIIPL